MKKVQKKDLPQWVTGLECWDCGKEVDSGIELEGLVYMDVPIWICSDCLKKALALLEGK